MDTPAKSALEQAIEHLRELLPELVKTQKMSGYSAASRQELAKDIELVCAAAKRMNAMDEQFIRQSQQHVVMQQSAPLVGEAEKGLIGGYDGGDRGMEHAYEAAMKIQNTEHSERERVIEECAKAVESAKYPYPVISTQGMREHLVSRIRALKSRPAAGEEAMSNRTLIELNHDYCPRATEAAERLFGSQLSNYMRSGSTADLPTGVRFIAHRHHSEPEFKLAAQPDAPAAPRPKVLCPDCKTLYVRGERHGCVVERQAAPKEKLND